MDTNAPVSASRERGCSSSSLPSSRTPSGARAEQVGDVAGGAEQAGQALGGDALVAQQAQVPGGRAERVADLPVAEQAGVRVGGAANQPSMTGSRVRWMTARRETPAVSASRWRSAAAGSAKPSASSRAPAAFGVSRASSAGSRATAPSSGR